MAIYRCEVCEQLIDDDYFPCVEHPTDPTAFCCEACAEEIEEEMKEAKNPAWDMKDGDYL